MISFWSAWDRIQKNDVFGGVIDIASGIATFFPGIGTAIAVGLDIFNAFMDYKSEGGKVSKWQMVKDWMRPVTDWIKDKAKMVRDLPGIGAIVRIGEAIGKMTDGDMKGGIIDFFNALAWMTPLPFLGQLLGFLDWSEGSIMEGKTIVPENIKKYFDINFIVESLTNVIGTLINSVVAIITSIIENVKIKIENIKKSIEQGLDNPYVSGTLSMLNPIAGSINVFRQVTKQKVNDAVIVEPHSKDQILMAKNDGPFDKAIQDTVGKIDRLTEVMIEGYSAMVTATLNSGSLVSNAVASTVKTGNSNPHITGSGGDPIAEFRARAKNAIR